MKKVKWSEVEDSILKPAFRECIEREKSLSVKEYKRLLGSQKDRSINKKNFAEKAKYFGYEVTAEVKIIEGRKFRADWEVTKNGKSVLVEYEGINSKTARHTSLTGYTKDCEKYNLAQINGHKILRYTMINFCDVFNDLERFFA